MATSKTTRAAAQKSPRAAIAAPDTQLPAVVGAEHLGPDAELDAYHSRELLIRNPDFRASTDGWTAPVDVQPPPEGAQTSQGRMLIDNGPGSLDGWTAAVDTTPPHLTASVSHLQPARDVYPAPLGAMDMSITSTAMRIFSTGRQVDAEKARRELEAMDLMREPPLVQQYRSEVLAWLDRRMQS